MFRAFLSTYLSCDLFAMPRGIIPTSYVSFEKGKGFLKLFGHGSFLSQLDRKWNASIFLTPTRRFCQDGTPGFKRAGLAEDSLY
jgi:hypothetical protein